MKAWTKFISGFISGVLFAVISLGVTLVGAKNLQFKDITVGMWIFVLIGILVVILQLVPAFLLFWSFILSHYQKREGNEKT